MGWTRLAVTRRDRLKLADCINGKLEVTGKEGGKGRKKKRSLVEKRRGRRGCCRQFRRPLVVAGHQLVAATRMVATMAQMTASTARERREEKEADGDDDEAEWKMVVTVPITQEGEGATENRGGRGNGSRRKEANNASVGPFLYIKQYN